MSLLAAQALLQIGPFQAVHVPDTFQARPRDFVELALPSGPEDRTDLKVLQLRLIAKAMHASTELHDINGKIEQLDRIDSDTRASRNRSISRHILECQSYLVQSRLNRIVDQIVDNRMCA